MIGFKKCCISNSMDETGDILWNGSSEEDGNVGVDVRNLTCIMRIK